MLYPENPNEYRKDTVFGRTEEESRMLLLKATERNWGLVGPGDREKRTWKVNTDGTYLRKTTYHPVDPEDLVLEETEEGALYEEQL